MEQKRAQVEQNSPTSDANRLAIPPHRRALTAPQLTALMLCFIFGPIAGGLVLFWFSPTAVEPPLPGEVKLSTEWVESSEKGRRLVPCIIVRNTSTGNWGKLSVGLNEQFYSSGNMPVGPKSQVVLPLDSFIARNGSVRFPVGKRVIKSVILFAQMETGERGVSEFLVPPLKEGEPIETDWIQPSPKSPD